MNIGKKIKLRRVEQDLKQQDLADMADTTDATISRLENGLANTITNTTLTRIANALKVSLDWLVDESQDYPPPRQLVTNKQKKMKK